MGSNLPLIAGFLTKERDSGFNWSMVETKEVYFKNRLPERVDSRRIAFLLLHISLYHHFTFSASLIRQMFEYSRMNHGFDSTNLWRRMV